MEGVSSVAVCLYRLREECVFVSVRVIVCACASRKRKDKAVREEGVGTFFFFLA